MPVVNARLVNGVVRTSEPVWSNLERMAEAMTSWFTYDTHSGLYSWVINEAGNVVTGGSLTEADIIGPIQISGSGLTNLYNSVEIEYPSANLRDQPHYVRIELPTTLRNAYEPDNTLQMTSEFLNNQPQAMAMADITLRTSRLDRTVVIVMDYTKINLRAGDIISVTSDTYGWTAKEFRIMRVREIEGDDGSLRLEFTCSEYDDTIYEGDISEFLVGGAPGIRSIGAIGTPGTPTIVVANVESLPTQAVTSTVPSGVVDRFQFWAGNLAVTGNINSTTFDLVGTMTPLNANAFTAGESVTYTNATLNDGTWVWKTRGVNINGTGPYSNVSGNVAYVRNQAPDVILQNTKYVDAFGNTVLPFENGTTRFSTAPDVYEYTANGTYYGAIFTTNEMMIAMNGNVSEVRYSFPDNTTPYIQGETTSAAIVNKAYPLATGNVTELGLSTWINAAEWNSATYANTGFSGLNWGNWIAVSALKDEYSALPGNSAAMTLRSDFVAPNVFAGNVLIFAFGYSSTLVPLVSDYANVYDPWNNSYVQSCSVPYSQRTIIYNSNSATYEIPGTTGTTPQGNLDNLMLTIKIGK